MRSFSAVVWLGIAVGMALCDGVCAPAHAVVFGTDALGVPLTWTHTAIPGGAPPAGATALNVGGELHLTLAGAGTEHEVQVSSGTFFGSNTFSAPWFEVTWVDNNTAGVLPRIDFFATDTRVGKKSNRVTGGSLFGPAACCEHYGDMRYNDPGTLTHFAGGGNTGGAPALSSVTHRALVGKRPDGVVEFIYDGSIPGDDVPPFAKTFFSTTAGLGTDHSAWGTLELRVRFAEAAETFIFRNFKMGSAFGLNSGDTDVDGDVDALDAVRTIANFGMTDVTRLQGDATGDMAVGAPDLTALAGTYTGMNSFGRGATITESSTPGAASLLYNPNTGNVQLDPTVAPGGAIKAFVLQNTPLGAEFNAGSFANPYGNALFDDTLYQMGAADDTLTGIFALADLGNIFPLGLDATALAAFLTRADYVGTEGTGLEAFNLLIVPEPSTLGLLLLGSTALLIRFRRRRV